MKRHANLIPVKPLTWDEVFSLWRDAESHLPHWVAHFTKSGYASWDAWRLNTIRELRYQGLEWTLFEIADPLAAVPDFVGGPFRPWITKYYDGARHRTFRELARHPAVQANASVQAMLASFPPETHLLGLQTALGTMIIEGMHRCCALALAAASGKPVAAKVFIALAPYAGEVPEMGRATSPT